MTNDKKELIPPIEKPMNESDAVSCAGFPERIVKMLIDRIF